MSRSLCFYRQLSIIYLLLLLTLHVNMSQGKLQGLDFEVFGVVQGKQFPRIESNSVDNNNRCSFGFRCVLPKGKYNMHSGGFVD